MSNSSLAQDGDEGSQRDEVFEDTGLDLGSHLGSIDEEQDSWSRVETGRKEELEWYREAAEQEPDGQGADDGRPVRHPKRQQAAAGPYEALAVHPAVCQAIFEEKRKPSVKLPWEVGFGRTVFQAGASPGFLSYPFALPVVGRADVFARMTSSSSKEPSSAWVHAHPFKAKRLFATRMSRSEDQLRDAALGRIKQVVLYGPNDSRLGRSLLELSGLLMAEHQLAMVFSDTFAKKATSTLSKRSCDYLRLAKWQVETNRGRPLKVLEKDMCDYVCALRSDEAAPTAAAAFISSWRFFHYMTGGASEDNIVSQRVEGAAHSCYLRKRPLRQAPPYRVKTVRRLEEVVLSGSDLHAVIGGFGLFCMFSAARWSDAAKATGLRIDTHGRIFLVEAVMLGHKTAKKADERTAFMPLLALGHTLEDDPWAAAWMAARTRMGMDDLEVVMPAYAEQSRSWLARPMTSAEGCAWLQEILCENGMEPEEVKDLTTHSLKATPLSWATKSGRFSKDEKRVLGHHAAPDEKMIVTYGRDVMTPVLAKLQHLVDAIRSDQFDPDLPRAARLSTLVQKLNEEVDIVPRSECRVQDLEKLDESEQSDVSAQDHDGLGELPSLVPDPPGEGPEPPESGTYVRRRISCIVHAIGTPASFLRCGRTVNSNYDECAFDPRQPSGNIFCEQCRAARVPRE